MAAEGGEEGKGKREGTAAIMTDITKRTRTLEGLFRPAEIMAGSVQQGIQEKRPTRFPHL